VPFHDDREAPEIVDDAGAQVVMAIRREHLTQTSLAIRSSLLAIREMRMANRERRSATWFQRVIDHPASDNGGRDRTAE
jgi:hypothetical protein